jgi:hypothetical protein
MGNATLAPVLSVLLTVMHWRSALGVAAASGAFVGVLIRWLMPPVVPSPAMLKTERVVIHDTARTAGSGLLFTVGILDTANRHTHEEGALLDSSERLLRMVSLSSSHTLSNYPAEISSRSRACGMRGRTGRPLAAVLRHCDD